jgi:hypothetical protein
VVDTATLVAAYSNSSATVRHIGGALVWTGDEDHARHAGDIRAISNLMLSRAGKPPLRSLAEVMNQLAADAEQPQ